MTSHATITFAQTGVQPPVYVLTSLSEPPWETLEMEVDKEQTASANLIFARRFENVAEGSYQYKIRIGDGHWVVDDSKDSGTTSASPHCDQTNTLQPPTSRATTTTSFTSKRPPRPNQHQRHIARRLWLRQMLIKTVLQVRALERNLQSLLNHPSRPTYPSLLLKKRMISPSMAKTLAAMQQDRRKSHMI
jgi:hypothetical protein